jgi:predicted transcriptional regulator
MSPRAAWRLETLGFSDVCDYVDGKVDWMAAGLPTEGTNNLEPRAGGLARKDAPTCGLTEKVGDVKTRVNASGWNAVVVVNDERVVLGLLRSKELGSSPEQLIEKVMRPGPSTFRPFVSAHEMLHFMADHKLENSPITTSDGRLFGLLLQKDVIAAMEKKS